MTSKGRSEWKRRREIPEPAVKDAAEQYNNAARVLLDRQPPHSGVVLPLLNVSAVALELYLKALATRQVRLPDENVPGVERVYAEAETTSHVLQDLLDAVPQHVRERLEREYEAADFQYLTKPLAATVNDYEGLFAASRYSYEANQDIRPYSLPPLMELLDFLARFVAECPYEDVIEWS